MGIIDKILGALLAVAIVFGAASLWYADHEHARIKPLQDQISIAQHAAQQAASDRDTAIRAEQAAQNQLRAAEAAASSAQAAAAQATSAAAAAKTKIAHAAQTPSTAQLLNTQVPTDVWTAIYTTGK